MKIITPNAAALKKLGVTRFDVAEHLDSPETIREYLNQVLMDGDTEEILRAIHHAARAIGMARLAADAGLARESLYKALAPGAKPRADTVFRVIRAMGLQLQTTAPAAA